MYEPLAGQEVWHRLALIVTAERMAFERKTGYPAPDFEMEHRLS